LAQQGEAGVKHLRTLYDKSTDKTLKGQALFAIGSSLVDSADSQAMSPDKQAAAFKEAEQTLTQAAKEYGDVKYGGVTIEKAVADKKYILNNLTVGKVLPDVEVQDLEGKKVKISDMRGKVVVLDIWATWCGPCRAMIPHEREMVKKLESKPFALISLSADDKKETLTGFLEKEPMPWTQWWNGSSKGAALEKYQIRFFPTIYIIDGKGVIRGKNLRGAALEKAVEGLIVQTEKS
jgi:thiol-disulfide isomerase/thioredoxin